MMSSNAGPWTSSTRLGVSGRPWTWYPGLVRQRVVVPTWERGTLAVRYLFHNESPALLTATAAVAQISDAAGR